MLSISCFNFCTWFLYCFNSNVLPFTFTHCTFSGISCCTLHWVSHLCILAEWIVGYTYPFCVSLLRYLPVSMEGIRLLKVLFCITLVTAVLTAHSDSDLSFVTMKWWVNPQIPVKNSLKFCSRPILYYSNTAACFQLSTLLSGDIEPNPGPQYLDGHNYDHDHVHTSQYTDYAPSSRICYDLNTLY